jgi:hypothetical protein
MITGKISDEIDPYLLPSLELKAYWVLNNLSSQSEDRFSSSIISNYLVEKLNIPTSRQAVEFLLTANKGTCHKNKLGFKLMHNGVIELTKYVKPKSTQKTLRSGTLKLYVNKNRFSEIKKKKGNYDFARLVQMLREIEVSFFEKNYISVIFLIRAIIDHVPPIFGFNTFSEFANNYAGAKSFKDSMLHLENSSRKIADAYLHIKIRKKESLPNATQVNFSNDLDVLLAEIVRVS